jgi:hypothetical protein
MNLDTLIVIYTAGWLICFLPFLRKGHHLGWSRRYNWPIAIIGATLWPIIIGMSLVTKIIRD